MRASLWGASFLFLQVNAAAPAPPARPGHVTTLLRASGERVRFPQFFVDGAGDDDDAGGGPRFIGLWRSVERLTRDRADPALRPFRAVFGGACDDGDDDGGGGGGGATADPAHPRGFERCVRSGTSLALRAFPC